MILETVILDDLCMKIGERIKQARAEASLSQPQLAQLCGWDSQSRISQYETGKNEPGLDDIKRVAEALGVSFGWLASGEEQFHIDKNPLTSEEKALVDNYRHSDERGRKMIRGIAESQSDFKIGNG